MRRAPMEKPTRRTGRPPWAPLMSTCASSSPALAALPQGPAQGWEALWVLDWSFSIKLIPEQAPSCCPCTCASIPWALVALR